MSLKVIFYILVSIGYFIYISRRNAQQQQRAKGAGKTQSPVLKNPIEEILEQMKRAQEQARAAEEAARKKATKPVQTFQQQKEILLRQKPATGIAFEEGTNMEAAYEREMTYEEKLHEERMKKQPAAILIEEPEVYSNFNAREAFIASVIFERKY